MDLKFEMLAVELKLHVPTSLQQAAPAHRSPTKRGAPIGRSCWVQLLAGQTLHRGSMPYPRAQRRRSSTATTAAHRMNNATVDCILNVGLTTATVIKLLFAPEG